MLSKAMESLRSNPSRPQAAMVPANKPPIFPLDVNKVIAGIKERRAALCLHGYMDMVPLQFRDAVTRIAVNAYPEKGQGMLIEVFIERMALQWLAKREIFDQVAGGNGFSAISRLSLNEGRSIMALTENGSLVALSPVNGGGQRGIMYGRIQLREDSNVLPFQNGDLSAGPAIGQRFITNVFHSSPVIALCVKRNAGEENPLPQHEKEVLARSVMTMTRAFDDLGKTIWVVRR